MKTLTWNGCYDLSWKGFISPASFSHPAKMSRGLLERIIAHGFEKGYWRENSIIGDCFGGVGTTGIIGAYHGLRVVSVELEKKFVSLARRNYALHSSKWKALGSPRPVILQGDSRAFHALVGKADAMVSSPPFTQGYQSGGGINKNGYGPDGADKVGSRTYQGTGGDRTAGNIETLKEGSVSGVISSPPYAVISTGAGGLNTKTAKHPGQQSGRSAKAASQDTDQKYGQAVGQIAALKEGSVDGVVASPPYAGSIEGRGDNIDWEKAGRPNDKVHRSTGRGAIADGYGQSAGQIGALKSGSVDGVVSSPPYVDGLGHGGKSPACEKLAAEKQHPYHVNGAYGESPGQIERLASGGADYLNGQTSVGPENYWMAMDKVYRSCYQAIKPGGVLVLVVKDFVKGGQRVPLCDDTVRLIEHIGFQMVECVHAMLVKETVHADLFNGSTTTKTERKSFFRRLHEKKPGAVKIDYEEVRFAKRL